MSVAMSNAPCSDGSREVHYGVNQGERHDAKAHQRKHPVLRRQPAHPARARAGLWCWSYASRGTPSRYTDLSVVLVDLLQDRMEIRAISFNLSSQVGADDLLLWVPVVPDGRDGRIVYARTLRTGESNPNVPVAFDPEAGETLQFRPGSIEISILDVDRYAQHDSDGFAPISNTLWTWLSIGTPLSTRLYYHLLAAGRRLDGTHSLLRTVLEQTAVLSGNFIERREQFLQAFAWPRSLWLH